MRKRGRDWSWSRQKFILPVAAENDRLDGYEIMNANAKKLAGKVAVVTGASKGIGAAIAKQLAAEGASVAVNYASSKTGAEKVVDEIVESGGTAIAIQADVAKKADVKRLFVKARKAFG